jgi:hypothetical protein
MLLMGKSTISMAIFNSYVSSPEGIKNLQSAGFANQKNISLGDARMIPHFRWSH